MESSDCSRCCIDGGGFDGGGKGGNSCSGKHVVVVMDALKEFSIKPLEWALEHVVEPGNMLTLLGVMPWLSLPRKISITSVLEPLSSWSNSTFNSFARCSLVQDLAGHMDPRPWWSIEPSRKGRVEERP